jgi:hypothetical protein
MVGKVRLYRTESSRDIKTRICVKGILTLMVLGSAGMVSTLRALGVTHATVGNHEADLKVSTLEKRLRKLAKGAKLINSNIKDVPDAPWFKEVFHPWSVLQTPCRKVTVAMGGFLSDEEGVFRDNTFKGAHIGDVTKAFDRVYRESVLNGPADVFLPVTHQTIYRDTLFAKHVLQTQPGLTLVLGGHEHSHYDLIVKSDNERFPDRSARILKGDSDATSVNLVDLTFDIVNDQFQTVEIDASLIDITAYEPSKVVQSIVDSHMSLLDSLDHETIVNADNLLPPGTPLSSERTRYSQTTVGSVLCQAIKEELEVDVAVINGATIKGNKRYEGSVMSYAQLKEELPFPTKMVVVPMKRWELQQAIYYSRTNPPSSNDIEEPERKGFLQVDVDFDRLGSHTGGQEDELLVALPRNLLKGFCKILPLMDIGDRLEKVGSLDLENHNFVPAIDLVVRHFCKEQWYELVHDNTFESLDRGDKGFLSREDVKTMMHKALGHEPAAFLVDDMISSIDADNNGVIDPGEFSHLLAQMERDHGMIKFD